MILTFETSSYPFKDGKTGYNLAKNGTQDLAPNFRTKGFKYNFFNRIINEWNGLPNHIPNYIE